MFILHASFGYDAGDEILGVFSTLEIARQMSPDMIKNFKLKISEMIIANMQCFIEECPLEKIKDNDKQYFIERCY